MPYQAEEKARLKRRYTERAIALAMHSRWEEAIMANRAITELFPAEVDAFNRLGKALTELGHYAEARESYQSALQLDTNNSIAKKNLARLTFLKGTQPTARRQQVAPKVFIEETGKTALTTLHKLAPTEVLAKITAGEEVYLRIYGKSLRVETAEREYLGQIEPKLGLRVIKLMEGGNKYSAAIASLRDNASKIIIREVFQHPSMAGRLSFPSRGTEGFRPYIKESLIKYELEDEDEELNEGEEYTSEWEEDALPSDMHIAYAEDRFSSDDGPEVSDDDED